MSERDLPSRGQPANPEDVVHGDPVPGTAPDIEEPEADFIEQHLVEDEEEAEETPPEGELPLDASEGDVVAQRAAAPIDDEYR